VELSIFARAKFTPSSLIFWLITCNTPDFLTTVGGNLNNALLSGRLRWTLLPKERYGESLFSGRGSNTQPSNWEADTILPSYRRPKSPPSFYVRGASAR